MASSLPIADHLSLEEIRLRRRKSRCVIEQQRWSAIHLLAQGESVRRISETLDRSTKWIRDVLKRYNEGGPDALVDGRRHNRRERLLSERQHRAVFEVVQHEEPPGGGAWTSEKLREWLREREGVEISSATAKRTFHRAGLSRQTPRPTHDDADPDAQQAFKKGGSSAS